MQNRKTDKSNDEDAPCDRGRCTGRAFIGLRAVRLSLARSVCCATTGFCRIVWRPERIGSYHTEQSPVHRRISCGCTGDFLSLTAVFGRRRQRRAEAIRKITDLNDLRKRNKVATMRKLASIQRIWKIEPIEGADRIELAHVLGCHYIIAAILVT